MRSSDGGKMEKKITTTAGASNPTETKRRSVHTGWRFVILFILIFVLVNRFLTLALCDDVEMRVLIKNAASNSADDVVIGTSMARVGIDPETVSKITGKSCANYSIPMSVPMDQYYLIRLMTEHGRAPKRVIYDVDPTYCDQNKSVSHHYAYPHGIVRLQYYWSGLQYNWHVTISPWSLYTENLSKMGEILKSKMQYFHNPQTYQNFNGFDPRQGTYSYVEQDNSDSIVTKEADHWLRKMASYCKEHGIELILMEMPVGKQIYYDYNANYRQTADAYFQTLAKDCSVTLWNMNELPDSVFNSDTSQYADGYGHLNERAAEEFSQVLGEKLKQAS